MCYTGPGWCKLTPDLNGSYLNGTWSTLASLPSGYNPEDFASAVLADGRVVVEGGEYLGGSFALTNKGAIYDPVANTWTMLTPPTSGGSPNIYQCIGDAPATVLADGRFLVGTKLNQSLTILDPTTLTWSAVSATGKIDGFNSEEGWTLLPDGSVFTLDVRNAPYSERFLLSGSTTGTWASSGTTPQDLHTSGGGSKNAQGCPTYNPPGEVGPTLLLPNGKVFAIGADGLTGIYTPPAAGSTATGSWVKGPALPSGSTVADGPGVVLPSGHVLFGASGLKYFEFDGTNLISVPAPPKGSGDQTYRTSLLLLPTGQAMFVDGSNNTPQLYAPAASPSYQPAWAPTITSVPSTLNNGTTYLIGGTQFNGLNQGCAFGDEQQNATNYPLVRITNNATGHVFYARTHNHSTMGVATGSATVYTYFDVPINIENGPSIIQVVANAIPSAPAAVTVTGSNTATTTQLSCSPNPSIVGQLVTCTSTTTSSAGAPAGSVTFTEGSNVLASNVTVDSSGHASFGTTGFNGGSHTILATFTGATGWTNSSGSATANVSDFAITPHSSTVSTKQGQSSQVQITVTALNGFTGNVTLSVAGVPTGLSASFNPTSITGQGNSNLTLTPNGTSAGTYPITVTGTSGGVSHSTTVNLTVTPGGNISMTANPTTVKVSRSTNPSSTTLITITSSSGFAGNVALTASGLPNGANVSFSPSGVSVSSGNPGTSTMTLSVSAGTSIGNSNVNITANSGSGGPQTQTKVTLQVAN